jgi:hypothetical protein
MPLPVPNLDDRTFDQLTAEAEGLIPRNLPSWTDHNESDPGITMLELFAFLIEATIYQVNRVPDRSLNHFGALVGVRSTPDESIVAVLHRALGLLSFSYRAVTPAEFQVLAKAGPSDLISIDENGGLVPDPSLAGGVGQSVGRAKAIVETSGLSTPTNVAITETRSRDARNRTVGGLVALSTARPTSANVFPGDQIIKVIILPDQPDAPAPLPSDELCQRVFELLGRRRLITARVRVAGPDYTPVAIQVTVVRDLQTRLSKSVVQRNIDAAITGFVGPLTGGHAGSGWDFGRSVYRSELDEMIQAVEGVDYVRELLLNGDAAISELPLLSPSSLVQLEELTVFVLDN